MPGCEESAEGEGGAGPQLIRILSLCGGMGTVGYVTARVQRIFGQQVMFHVVEVEIDPAARRMCQHVTGGHTQHAQPSDLWEWAVNEKRTKEWIKALGTIHWVVCGFSCQDMSVAQHRKGQGLKGDRSSVYFAATSIRGTGISWHTTWEYLDLVPGPVRIPVEHNFGRSPAGSMAKKWENSVAATFDAILCTKTSSCHLIWLDMQSSHRSQPFLSSSFKQSLILTSNICEDR